MELTPKESKESEKTVDSPTQDSESTDLDKDGFSAPEDCNDADATIAPGVSETWDKVDQDCDGRIDGNGHYEGTMKVDATAVYEGNPYRFSLTCPTVLDRGTDTLTFVATCTPDPKDAMAQLLLGSSFTLTADDTVASSDWSGDVIVASSSGWDTRGDGSARWSGFDSVALAVSLSKVSLGLSAKGDVSWDKITR